MPSAEGIEKPPQSQGLLSVKKGRRRFPLLLHAYLFHQLRAVAQQHLGRSAEIHCPMGLVACFLLAEVSLFQAVLSRFRVLARRSLAVVSCAGGAGWVFCGVVLALR